MLFHQFLKQTLVLGLFAGGLVATVTALAQAPPPGEPSRKPDSRPSEPATSQPKKAPEAPRLAFPADEEQTYLVTYKGETTGTVKLGWHAPDGEPRLLLEGTFDFNGRGRRLISTTETWYGPGLRALRMKQNLHMFSNPELSGGRQVGFVLENGVATVGVTDLNKGQTQKTSYPIDDETFILERQVFEHWLVVASVLPSRGSPSLKLFEPSSGTFMQIQFNLQPKEDDDPPGTSRWYFHHTSFAASLWVTPDGQLVKYRQDDTEFVRVAK